MKRNKLTEDDLDLLNSKKGLTALLQNDKVDVHRALADIKYAVELRRKQEELIKLQSWVIKNDLEVVILFEGRDAAGKGGAIRRITQYINPRHFRIVALNIPTEDEKKQWFFQRYINQLPKPGEIVFFDRSWYNRAVVEPVNGFCTKKEYKVFMGQVNDFERMIQESGTHLIKFYLSITKKEQAKRFAEIKSDPRKRWKITPVDEKAQELWDLYTEYKTKMFTQTDTKISPWKIVDANRKSGARMETIDHILKTIPYK